MKNLYIKFLKNKFLISFFLLNIIFDLFLFFEAYSWTPMLYENVLIFLPCLQKKSRELVSTLIGLILLITKVLYFNFYLTIPLLIDFWYFQIFIISLIILIGFALSSLKVVFREITSALFFLFAISFSYYYADKEILHDKFISSYTPHFLGSFISNKKPEESHSEVYNLIKNDLSHNKGVILVIWESLGIPSNNQLIGDLAKFKLQKISELNWEGGSTVPAEMRHLCGTNNGFYSENCLPKLALRSYALHGNSLSYFNRNRVYKEYGFEVTLGKKILSKHTKRICSYAYDAICDEDLFKELFKIVGNNKCDGFFYALTIDSHYPYSNYKHHDIDLFADLNKFIIKAQAFRLQHKECNIYVVGDHPPPLSSNFSRNKILFIKI